MLNQYSAKYKKYKKKNMIMSSGSFLTAAKTLKKAYDTGKSTYNTVEQKKI